MPGGNGEERQGSAALFHCLLSLASRGKGSEYTPPSDLLCWLLSEAEASAIGGMGWVSHSVGTLRWPHHSATIGLVNWSNHLRDGQTEVFTDCRISAQIPEAFGSYFSSPVGHSQK